MKPTTLNRLLVLAALLIVGLVTLAQWIGVRINLSDSIARGLWLVTTSEIAVGEYVLVCPPNVPLLERARERGYIGNGGCPGGFSPLMKRIAAQAGDRVHIATDGVRVNGVLLPHSAPKAVDGAGRPLTAWSPRDFIVGQDELLLYGDGTPYSFDGRYFGPVSRALVQSVIAPLFVETQHYE